MSQHEPRASSAGDVLLRTLTQILRTQDSHTMLLQKVMEILTTEPEVSQITMALQALTENIQAQTQAISAQTTHVAAVHRAMSRLADALGEDSLTATSQSLTSRRP